MKFNCLFALKKDGDNFIDKYGSTLTVTGNTPTAVTGVFGGIAAQFDGYSKLEVTKDSDNFVAAEEYTVSFWYKADSEIKKRPFMCALNNNTTYDVALNSLRYSTNQAYYQHYGTTESNLGVTVVDGSWHHIAATYSNAIMLIFIDGKKLYTSSRTYPLTSLIGTAICGLTKRTDNDFNANGAVDNFVIVDKQLWTDDFTPPTHYLIPYYALYKCPSGVYGMSDSTFTKLADDWPALSDSEKVALFTATDGETPTVDELKTIGTKFKVLTYAADNDLQTCTVSAVPKELPELEVQESYTQENVVSTNVSDTVGLRPVLCVPDPKDTVITAPKCELTLKSKPTYTKPGEAFSFEYTVKTAGTLGTFAAPGEAIKPDLFDGPGTTPDGTAYFVNVGTEYNGAMKFVCDRNIQGGISWETLNTAGMCVTSGMDVSDFTGIEGSRMRLMESSVVNPDMDKRNSEWDEIIFQDYIPNSDVPTSKINDWNYAKTRSWMLNTPSQDDVAGNKCGMDARVVRGCEDRWYTTVGKRFLTSTDTYDTVCLRPVLTIPTDQQSVLADSIVTPTRTLSKDVLVETDFIFLNEEATLDNTTVEYHINKVALFNGEGQDNTLKPTSQHLTQTIPLERLDFGENEVMLQIRSAGLTNNIIFKVYREKIGDTARARDFLNYTGGHTLTNLAIRNNTVVSAAQSNEHENVTELKLPDNIISIKLED